MADLTSSPGRGIGDPRFKLPILGTIVVTWQVFARAPWKFIALVTVPILIGLVPILLAGGPGHKGPPGVQAVSSLLQVVTHIVLLGAAIHGAGQVMETGGFDLGASLAVGFRRALAMLGIGLLAALIVIVGILILIVPGLIAAMMFSVAFPACIIENRGPIDSLRRSLVLTKGHRWRILGLFLLVALGAAAIMVGFAALVGLVIQHVNDGIALLILFGAALVYLPAFIVLAALASVFYVTLFETLRGGLGAQR